jgi:hypothetical protein
MPDQEQKIQLDAPLLKNHLLYLAGNTCKFLWKTALYIGIPLALLSGCKVETQPPPPTPQPTAEIRPLPAPETITHSVESFRPRFEQALKLITEPTVKEWLVQAYDNLDQPITFSDGTTIPNNGAQIITIESDVHMGTYNPREKHDGPIYTVAEEQKFEIPYPFLTQQEIFESKFPQKGRIPYMEFALLPGAQIRSALAPIITIQGQHNNPNPEAIDLLILKEVQSMEIMRQYVLWMQQNMEQNGLTWKANCIHPGQNKTEVEMVLTAFEHMHDNRGLFLATTDTLGYMMTFPFVDPASFAQAGITAQGNPWIGSLTGIRPILDPTSYQQTMLNGIQWAINNPTKANQFPNAGNTQFLP